MPQRWLRSVLAVVPVFVIAVAAALSVPAAAQEAEAPRWSWPERAENLEVLPQDVPSERLALIMGRFSRSLGVRCSHCHVGVEGEPLATYDFASDANPNKDTAREMYRMLGSINDHLAKIEPTGERVNMWCHTCHRGQPRPQTLAEALGEAYRRDGADAMLARYDELKEGAAGAVEFEERALNSLGYELLQAGDVAGALAAFRLNAAEYPDSGNVWDSLAEAYLVSGQPELAEIYYEKSLLVDPGNDHALEQLRRIRRDAPSDGAATPPGRSSGSGSRGGR